MPPASKRQTDNIPAADSTVADRPGHDRRYALDTAKLRGIGWRPEVPFEDGLAATVAWYRANEWWWRPIKEQDPAFKAYYEKQYQHRQ